MEKLIMFENRLSKRLKHLKKWAKREQITCYRIYDRDIPEFPFSIDLYEDLIYFAEYERTTPRNAEEQEVWIEACKEIVAKTLGLPLENLFVRHRQQQKGSLQYEKIETRHRRRIVEENGLRFMVNLTDYLDAGLFLDHRITRSMVAAEAQNSRFLNLFAYTGSFSVYAAAGGAASTTSVDMSATYLQWAQDNMRLNSFIQNSHQYLQNDVLQWLRQSPPPDPLYTLAVIDPPTFSNSKRMKGIFDIQRDHVWLINQTFNKMSKKGVIYFSNNYRRFKLDSQALKASEITDITRQTIPEDFIGNRPHICFRLVK
ncbi:MAG: class I SAM-dependent methyltransferase [Sphingobacteriales bacterium]|nr:MAG: class I SAM-dependent methyltransferase [Sphingobacteriales bacterium]